MTEAAAAWPAPPGPDNDWHAGHVRLLCDSHERVVGRPLCACVEPAAVFRAAFVLLSHGTEADPLFNYANQAALDLFELDWAQFVRTPSRVSAEAPDQQARARLMREVRDTGFIDDYAGVRVSSTGRRFRIERATVWNVLDEAGVLRGQAATFSAWTPV